MPFSSNIGTISTSTLQLTFVLDFASVAYGGHSRRLTTHHQSSTILTQQLLTLRKCKNRGISRTPMTLIYYRIFPVPRPLPKPQFIEPTGRQNCIDPKIPCRHWCQLIPLSKKTRLGALHWPGMYTTRSVWPEKLPFALLQPSDAQPLSAINTLQAIHTIHHRNDQ